MLWGYFLSFLDKFAVDNLYTNCLQQICLKMKEIYKLFTYNSCIIQFFLPKVKYKKTW